jgi:protein SCO1/2
MIWLALLLALLLEPALCVGATLDLSDYRWVQHPGAQLPMQEVFRDDSGQAVRAGDLAQGHPLILTLGYYRCPNLCGLARSTLLTALRLDDLDGSRDYTLAALSIDPHETLADSRAAKAADIAAFPLPGAKHWRYLIGDQQSIMALTNAVGYQSRFDPALKQFIHPTGLVVITPAGKVSSYLLGLGYQPGDLRVALAAANDGTIRSAVVPVLLLCFHYDATTGRYTLSILKLLKLAAALTLITVAGLGAFLFWREGSA